MQNSLIKRLLAGIGRVIAAFFNIGVKLKYVVILCVLLTAGSIFFTSKKTMDSIGGSEDFNEAKRYIEIKDIVEKEYIDTVDRSSMGDSAAAAMITGLGDKWSYYMSADEYNTYQLYSSNEYSDIGMSIMLDESSGGYKVIAVSSDSPAAWAGLSAGMVITAVDGQDIRNMEVDSVRTLIRSKLNSTFTLEINKGEYTLNVDCSSSYTSAVSYRLEKTMAGYVKIDNFEAGSGQDAVSAIEYLLTQNPESLCLDLRGNPGGLASELATLLDYLLPKGVLFAQVDKDGHQEITESDGMCVQLPMCVLINSETYGEAELCAAVLKEYGWATLLGETTPGQTRTQETFVLEDGSALRLSTRTYITANGTDISAAGGVIPDVIVYNSDPSTVGTTQGTLGASDGTASVSADEQLMAALKLLS